MRPSNITINNIILVFALQKRKTKYNLNSSLFLVALRRTPQTFQGGGGIPPTPPPYKLLIKNYNNEIQHEQQFHIQ